MEAYGGLRTDTEGPLQATSRDCGAPYMPGNGRKANCGNFPMGFAAGGQTANCIQAGTDPIRRSACPVLTFYIMGTSHPEMTGFAGHSCPLRAMVAGDALLPLSRLPEVVDRLTVPMVNRTKPPINRAEAGIKPGVDCYGVRAEVTGT